MSKLFFLHIPKNSGTSLNQIVKKNYSKIFKTSWKLKSDKHFQNLLNNGDVHTFSDFEVVSGHYPYGLDRLCEDQFEITYLTMLRDPIKRALSGYNYLRKDSKYVKSDKELEEYLSNLTLSSFLGQHHQKIPNHIYIDNGQVRYLSGIGESKPFGQLSSDDLALAKKNLMFTVFGITEKFNQSMLYFKSEGIFRNILYATQKIGTVSKQNISKQDGLDIRNRNILDMELYDYALKLFNERTNEINPTDQTIYKYKLNAYQLYIRGKAIVGKVYRYLLG